MQTDVTFTITENAKRRIASVTKEYEAKIEKDVITAILWLDSNLNDGMVESQPVVGFYHDRSEIMGDILTIDGLEIVLAISDEDNFRFQGKTLDYQDNRFVLR
jgi:hypothetical protein